MKSDEVIKSSVEDLVPIPSESKGIPDSLCNVPLCNNPTPLEAFKEHSETIIDSNNDYSTLSDDDSPYGEDIDYVDASPPDSEIVSLEVVEIVIPKVGGIDDDILLTIKDDILREKLLNVNLLIANNQSIKDIPLHLSQKSSGSTTTHSDYSLSDYEVFYSDDDHIGEKSSGSTTTHADFSKYDSFIFDLSINPFLPADRSDFYHEEFADELAHIISPPEFDHFCFRSKPELGIFTMEVVEDILPTREPMSSCANWFYPPYTLDHGISLLLSELSSLYCMDLFPIFHVSVAPPYLLYCGYVDTIFDTAFFHLSFFYAGDCPDFLKPLVLVVVFFLRITRRFKLPQLHFGK
ncbi:hypothetical protein Tco_1414352 [Tanacetum coccineum]